MRMGQRKKVNNTHKENGKEDGEETPADLKGHLMGMANGRVGRERGGSSVHILSRPSLGLSALFCPGQPNH